MNKRTWTAITAVPLVVFVLACGAAPAQVPDGDTIQQASTAPTDVENTKVRNAPEYSAPSPSDFSLTLTELERKCFGSAGCNVTFTLNLKQVTAAKFDPTKTYKLLYTINGTEDVHTNYMTLTGSQYTHDDEEFAQVKGQKTQLTVTITSIVAS